MDNQDKVKALIAAELQKETSLNDIQKLLVEQLQVKMTFLDLRLLASELEEVLKSMACKEAAAEQAAAKKEEEEQAKQPTTQAETGKTVVEVSKLVRPGALACGKVSFASGAKAEWIFDQTGRLGLDKLEGKPTEEDLKAFQVELQQLLSRNY